MPAENAVDLLRGFASPKAAVRFASAKALRKMSEASPERVYPLFGEIAGLLDSENQILRWNAIRTLGNLSAVDVEGRVEAILNKWLEPLDGPELITAANVILSMPPVVRAKPQLAGRIAARLMRVRSSPFPTPECTNVALGHAIRALHEIYPSLKRKKPVADFVSAELDNPRKSTRAAAARFVRAYLRDG